jgi:hypothetical protein
MAPGVFDVGLMKYKLNGNLILMEALVDHHI